MLALLVALSAQTLVLISGAGPGQRGRVIDSSQRGERTPQTEAVISSRLTIRIQGALVLPPEVYLEILDLPANAAPNVKTAALVRRQIRSFLKRTGYELATVTASVVNEGITVSVDEGQIERIILMGPLSYQLMRFKLDLELPNHVFNRLHFDQQVRELSELLDVEGVKWELVRTATVKHVGPQVVQPADAEDEAPNEWAFRARRPYEVLVYFPDTSLATTLGVDFRTDFLDGVQLGLINPSRSVLMEGDVLRLGARGGVGLRSKLDTQRIYPHFSRAYFGLGYDTSPIVRGLRANLTLEGNWWARQRADLNLENYNALSTLGAIQLQWELRPGLRFLGGAGLEWRRLFGYEVEPGQTPPPDVFTVNRLRQFLSFSQETVFNPSVLRWARRHGLETDLRQYLPSPSQPQMGFVDLRYQYVKELGWNDFWVRSRTHIAWGDVTFHDELSTGEFLRALFGDRFVPSAINLQLEFRLSIARDLLKLSLFHDLALLGEPNRTDGTLDVQLANGFGPGLHLLVWDMFQLDSYLAFGFRRGGELGVAFSLVAVKAF